MRHAVDQPLSNRPGPYRSQVLEMARSALRTVALDNGRSLGNSTRLRLEHLAFMISYISMQVLR